MKDRKNSSLLGRLEKFQRLFFVALLSVLAVGAFAQSKTVSGTVLDKTGESVIGASVVVKGTTNGTITDFDGKFTLQNVPDNGTIQVSFVGYKTVDIQVKGQSTVKIILEEDTETLDEVVVVGYGVQKKSDVTGAMARVTSKVIEDRPVQNALQAMQGRVTGVDITSNNRPGELGDIRIRGNRSLTADNNPLYVIDGIPMSAGSIADVNPSDIESMEILKDASATAIYGSRGANGVILVTTKKGKTGRTTINYDGSFSFGFLDSTTDYMNSGQLLDYNRQSAITGGTYNGRYGDNPDPERDKALWLNPNNMSYMDKRLEKVYQQNADGTYSYDPSQLETTDWGELVTRTAFTHNHQISLSAGTETSKLYVSLGYLDQKVPMKDQDFKRYTANINGEIIPTKWLKVGMGLNATHSIKNYGIVSNTSNTGAKDSYGLAMDMMPWVPAYNEDGSILEVASADDQAYHNPLRNIDDAWNETRYYGVNFSSYAELDFGQFWEPLKGVKWRTNLGAQYRNSRVGSYYGVDITSNNRPGELGDIRIRGNRSLTADNNPLYVIDGIPMSAGSIADVNPSDIESMEILKDASATAIYGSRGANGVILVTTKKGKTGRTTINYDGSFSFGFLDSTTDYMNSGQLLDYNRQSAITGGTYNGRYGDNPDPERDKALWLNPNNMSYMDKRLEKVYQQNADGTYSYDPSQLETTDWGELVTRTAFTHNHQISLSAGTETSKLYVSLGYLDQKVPMKDQDFKRYTANINGEIIPTKWLKVGMGLNATHSIKNYGIVSNTSNTGAKDSYGLAMDMMPWVPAYNEDGSILEVASADDQAYHNPLRNIDDAWNETRYYGVNFSSYAELDFGQFWEPLKGVKWRTNLGAQYRNSRVGSYYGEGYTNPFKNPAMAPNVANNEHSQKLSWTLENLLYINKTIKDIHSVNITLLQSAERYRTEGLNMRGYEITFPSSLWYNIGASNNAKYAPGSNFSTWSRASYMARVNYGLMDKYLLTVTGRFDGASMLAAGNKWDFFPSAALAWRMEQEKWIQQINWINQLKLRVGYGVTGNSAVNPYQTAGSVTSTYASIPFGVGNVSSNTIGTKTNIMPNYSLGWEKTSSLNVGVDFGVLENRISGSVEYYIAKTSDLLMNQSIPVITGYAQILNNVGKTENRGFEVSLSTVNVKTKDFTWQTDWTFSLNNEKIKELAGGATYDSTGPWMVGEPLNSFYDFQYDRIWQNTQEDNHLMDVYRSLGLTFLPGQYKIVDQPLVEVPQGTEGSKTVEIKDAAGNKTGEVVSYMDNGFGKFDDNDKKIYNKSPKWTGGINNSFTYKNWNLSFFTYFRFGNTYYGLTQTIGRRIEKDTWSPTNTDAKFAQPTTATRETKYDYVRNYTKGNMVLIKNIALSYTVPQSWLKKCGASSAQVYAQVLNPFLFGGELVKAGINPDDLTGWDAGNHIGGQTNNTCITRSLVLGVRLGF